MTFSEDILESSVTTNSFNLTYSGGQVAGTIDVNKSQIIFDPEQSLNYETNYTAKVTKDVKDLAGNRLTQDYT